MNLHPLGVQLIWAAGQVTIVLALGAVLYVVAHRRGPAMRALFAAGTLATALGMTLLVLSPWPHWYNVSLAPAPSNSIAPQPESQEQIGEGRAAKQQASVTPNDKGQTGGRPPTVTRGAQALEDPRRAAMSAFWQSLNDNLATPAPAAAAPAPAANWRWPAVLAAVVMASIAVAFVRLLLGLWAVARYRRSAMPINDGRLAAELSELQASLGCRRALCVCESATIGTPATIGWRRPLVLLPVDWRQWDDVDRRAVLAHELAHVARGDYLSGVIARLVTAVHFYHPLAHWLARRMRFEQELAADAYGVACSGSNESYVVALARMALAQDNRALAWAARPFLPSRTTFLRRIEMLRNSARVEHVPYRPATRRLALAALATAAIVVAGLRGPIASSGNRAVAQPPAATAADSQPIDVRGVPEDTVVYGVIRPAAILSRDAKLREGVEQMERAIQLRENIGISPSEVEEVRVMAVDLTVPGEHISIEPVVVLRTTKPEAWKSITDKFKNMEQTQHHDQQYFHEQGGLSGGGVSYLVVDPRTIVTASRETALRVYIDAARGGQSPRWADEFKRVAASDAAIAMDVRFFGRLLDKDLAGPGRPAGPDAAMILSMAPLWRQTNTFVAGVKVNGMIEAHAYGITKSPEAAKEVAATVTAMKVLAQNMLPVIRRQAAGEPGGAELGKLKSDMLDQAEKFLAQIEPTVEGNVVAVNLQGTEAFGPLVASVLLPAVAQAREAAQRAQDINNLKQIALALHNYHDVHKHFPPAVLLGPDGKTKYSWRVAILPYIEQQELYRQYDFNEPWDSENNKKVLAKVPPVLQYPTEHGKSVNSSYFLLTGEGGIFNDKPSKSGTTFAQIRDGTSNTLLIVEAKRNIPWTKPEDIPMDVDKELPKLGGYANRGFAAALADGSVRFLGGKLNSDVFKALFTASGGEAVSPQNLDEPAQGPRPTALTPQENLRRSLTPPQ
jgi:beta-lactamase regulating signal transducer with metallopeptidase domain